MSSATLLIGALLPTLTAIAMGTVGEVFRRRPARQEDRGAVLAYSAWWHGMGGAVLLYTSQSYAFVLGVRDPAAYVTILHALNLALAIALGGLCYYLLFLYTGSRRWLPAVAGFYWLFFAFNVFRYSSAAGEWRLEESTWAVTITSGSAYATPVFLVFTFAVTLPILGCVVAYASLYRRASTPTQRYRIGLVSGAFGFWFLAFLVGFLAGDPTESWRPIMFQSFGLVSALVVLLAYRPPGWVKARWSVNALDGVAA